MRYKPGDILKVDYYENDYIEYLVILKTKIRTFHASRIMVHDNTILPRRTSFFYITYYRGCLYTDIFQE